MSKNLNKIFDEFYSPLCNYATRLINDKHAAEDVVQSVFIQLWENDKLLELDNPQSYLLRCVKYKSIDYLRGLKNRKAVSFDELSDIPIQEKVEISEEDILPLMSFFAAQLPPKMQKVFLMSRKNGLSYKQIAEQLQVSTKTVENQMGTALKKLRQLLKNHHYLSIIFTVLVNMFF